MTRRAVGYARYSTDLQDERSIDDQIALIRRYCTAHDLDLAQCYSDAARSGASILGRDGLMALLDSARAGAFQVLVVEELDRLSRDIEDLAGIHKRLTFAGIDIVAVHEGVASTVTVGLRGLVGQMFREDNARKVRRGLEGRIRQGLSAGGRVYGYRPDPARRGQLVVIEGPDMGRAVRLEDRVLRIGSGASCDLVLTDPRVSRAHLRIGPAERAGEYKVHDLGSRNGTLLAGSRISEATVPIGASLKVGRTFLRIQPLPEPLEVAPSQARRFGELVAESLSMREVFAVLELAARSDVTVLLEGETGTGKELAARALHSEGARRRGPYGRRSATRSSSRGPRPSGSPS